MAPASCFLALSPAEAEARITELGGRPFHARVVRRELLERGVLSYEDMSGLSRELRRRLAEELPLLSGRETACARSRDGTSKLLLRFPNGACVETVHIPSRRRGRGATLCVSTQVGCPVGCPFCASGADGLVRNLATPEILEQFLRGRARGPLSRAVVMGIGEPLLNLESVLDALEVVRGEMGIGARRITVSTIGFPERVKRLASRRPPFQLAISLHSPFDSERSRLVPAMADVAVEDVLEAGDEWFARTGRELTYEYVLLGGTNDSKAHAERLAERLHARRATVNLIPFNAVSGSAFRPPHARDVEAFREILSTRGLVATVRHSRGSDEAAACGQLRIRRS